MSRSGRPQGAASFPTTQLALLALVRVAEPIALTSVLPYALNLVLTFRFGRRDHAPFYAGILIAAFSLSESLSSMLWGKLSDRIGRKPVLLLGSAGTILSLCVLGFSTNFWIALVGRVFGGLLNGNIGVIQTMVGELIVNPEHEPIAYAIMPFVWSIGTVVGPCIGGFFSDPVKSFPKVFSPTGVFSRFPYLLPNLICALLLVVAMVCGYFFLEETHPNLYSRHGEVSQTEYTPLNSGIQENTDSTTSTCDSYGTFSKSFESKKVISVTEIECCSIESTPAPITIFTKDTLMLIAALGIFSYHSMSYDTLLPIFLQDEFSPGSFTSKFHAQDALAGGLGLSIRTVGLVLSINGLIELFVQAVIFPVFASYCGTRRLFQIVTIGHPLAYLLVPLLVFIPLKVFFPTLYAFLAIRDCFTIIAYPLVLIMLKESCKSPSHLGQANGAAASVAAGCRTLASPLSGYLYAVGVRQRFAPLAWWVSGAVAVVGAVQVLFIRRKRDRWSGEEVDEWPVMCVSDIVHAHLYEQEERYLEYSDGEEEIDGFEPLLRNELRYNGP